jgi:hypothetical protein
MPCVVSCYSAQMAYGCRHAVFITLCLFFFLPPNSRVVLLCVLSTRSSKVGHPSTNPRSFPLTSPFLVDLLYFSLCLPLLRLTMRSLFTLFTLVASACAYQILTPNNSSGWTTGGPNNVTWVRVSTDQPGFTMVLVNQVRSLSLTRPFPPTWASFSAISGQDHHAIRLGNPHCDSRWDCGRYRCPRT